jgi:hypothetical protein
MPIRMKPSMIRLTIGRLLVRRQFLIDIEVIAAPPPDDKYRDQPAVFEEENGAGRGADW